MYKSRLGSCKSGSGSFTLVLIWSLPSQTLLPAPYYLQNRPDSLPSLHLVPPSSNSLPFNLTSPHGNFPCTKCLNNLKPFLCSGRCAFAWVISPTWKPMCSTPKWGSGTNVGTQRRLHLISCSVSSAFSQKWEYLPEPTGPRRGSW